MADNENLNTEAIEPVEVVHGLDVSKSLLGATLGATAAEEQEPDEEYETIPVKELLEVKLGRQGENDTQAVVIDCSAWLEQLPGCTLMIAATRPGEREIYLPEVTVESGVVTWPIMEQDTACAGTGRAEVRAMLGDKIKKSALFRTRVEPALEGDGSPDAPTPPNWVKLIIGAVDSAEQAAETAQAQVQGALEAAENAEAASEAAQEAAEGAVRYNAAQALTEAERFMVRRNIGADDDGICVENNRVRAYLADTVYDGDDYSYTRVLDYAADDYDHPAGDRVEWEYSGTCSGFKVRVTLDGDDARAHTYSLPNTAREFDVVNLIPGEVAEVKVSAVSGSAETVILSRAIRASGTVRMIAAEGVHNARDIGSWKCTGGRVKYGMIYRGGILDGLTNEGKIVLHDLLGIRAEVDVRSGGSSDTSVIGADCTRYRYTGKQYSAAFDDTSLSYEILHRIYTEVMAGNPVYVHCNIGCDRTGTYIGLIEGLLGMSESDISKDYELSDFTNSSLVDGGRYRNTANWTGLIGRIKGETGETFAEKVESYFLRIGFTAEEIENLRKAMTNMETDESLSVIGRAADAAAVSAALAAQAQEMEKILAVKVDVDQGSDNAGKALIVGADGSVTLGETGVPEAVATALLDCLMHVAWIDDRGPELVQALADALDSDIEPVVPIDTITVDFVKTASPSAGDSVDVLRTQITVTAYYADETSEEVTGYALLPDTLAAGENTIRVRFRGVEKPIWVYVPTGSDDHCVYSLPVGTDLSTPFSTGIQLNDVNKSYTVLFKGTDDSIISESFTAEDQKIICSSLFKILANVYAGIKVFYRVLGNREKNYIISHNGVNKNWDGVISSNASHQIIWAIRQTANGNTYSRMMTLFVDGAKIVTDKTNNLDSSGFIATKPLLFSTSSSSVATTKNNIQCWVGEASLFRIYDTALSDSEINAILGVTI